MARGALTTAAAAAAAAAVVLVSGAGRAAADTPAHCLYNQTVGGWTFYLSAAGGTNKLACPATPAGVAVASTLTVTLSEPDVATLSDGSTGWWSMLYDEGFHVVSGGRKFFAFQNWTTDPVSGNVTSNCGVTLVGYYHDAPAAPGVLPLNWGCYYGVAASGAPASPAAITHHAPAPVLRAPRDAVYRPDVALANAINAEQSLWRAAPQHAFAGYTVAAAATRAGSPTAHHPSTVRAPAAAAAARARVRVGAKGAKGAPVAASDLPAAWDWRNGTAGLDLVCPVRNQGNCGSCYSFGSTGSLCSRTAIATKGAGTALWSPQTVVSCSPYTQGCSGGFGYNVFKFGEDWGIPWDTCFPYVSGGTGTPVPACSAHCNDTTQYNYVTDFQFVGGYYGASTEANMMAELFANGPLSVEFYVYPDFMHYTSGVYVHTTAGVSGMQINPWVATNHEVQLIGWGVDNGVPYWTCQNSWGTGWGEGGYFRILRGVDECAIESIPSVGTPVIAKGAVARHAALRAQQLRDVSK